MVVRMIEVCSRFHCECCGEKTNEPGMCVDCLRNEKLRFDHD